MRLCASWEIGFPMNLGKISAKFPGAITENLAPTKLLNEET
jgi:hypothetical protein